MSARFRSFLLLGCAFVAALNLAPALRVLWQGCPAREPVPVVRRSPAEIGAPARLPEEPVHLVALGARGERRAPGAP